MATSLDRFVNDLKGDKIGGRTMLDWSDHLYKQKSEAFEVEHTGTVFKLTLLSSYVTFPYLSIMANRRREFGTKLIFLDLYSGNGLNKIKDLQFVLCGSSLLALLHSHYLTTSRNYSCYFDHYVMVDGDKKSITILHDRCKTILNDLDMGVDLMLGNKLESNAHLLTLNENAQDKTFISRLCNWLDSIWDNEIHILLFIDPDTPANFSIDTLIKLLQYPGDLLILLHPGIFAKQVLTHTYRPETLETMLGISETEAKDLLSYTSSDELSNYYVQRFKDVIGKVQIRKLKPGSHTRNVIESIPIRTKKQHYELLIATRVTGGTDSPQWQKALLSYAKEIGKLSDSGKTIVDIIQGPQHRLDEDYY